MISNYLGRCAALVEKLLLLDDPAIAVYVHGLLIQLTTATALLTFNSDRIAPSTLQDDLVAELRLSQRSPNGAFDVFPPDLARSLVRLQPHEIRRRLLRIVSIGILAVIQKFAGDALGLVRWSVIFGLGS